MTEETNAEFIATVMELGMTQYEAQVYAALFQLKYATITELHTVSGVPRNKIYETLDSLVEKEFATVIDTNPLKYAQTDLEKTFITLRKKEREKLDRIETYLVNQEMSQGLYKKSISPHAYEMHTCLAIESHIDAILRQTRKELNIGVSDTGLFCRLFPKPLLKKLEKKITVNVILFSKSGDSEDIGYPCYTLRPEFFTKMLFPEDTAHEIPKFHSKIMMISDSRTLMTIDSFDTNPSGSVLLMKHPFVFSALLENLQTYFVRE